MFATRLRSRAMVTFYQPPRARQRARCYTTYTEQRVNIKPIRAPAPPHQRRAYLASITRWRKDSTAMSARFYPQRDLQRD